MKRRRFKQTQSLEDRLTTFAQQLRAQAKALPPGHKREIMLRQARQNEMASEITSSLSTKGAKAPLMSR